MLISGSMLLSNILSLVCFSPLFVQFLALVLFVSPFMNSLDQSPLNEGAVVHVASC